MSIFDRLKLAKEYRTIYGSAAYQDTVAAIKKIIDSTFLVMSQKPDEDQQRLLTKAQSAVQPLMDAIAEESPLVGALALIMALRVQHNLIEAAAKTAKGTR